MASRASRWARRSISSNFMCAVIDKASFDNISRLPGGRSHEARVRDRRRRQRGRLDRLLRRADRRADHRSALAPRLRGDLRSGPHGLRLRRQPSSTETLRSATPPARTRSPARSSRRTVRRDRSPGEGAAARGRQLLHQRQADRRRRRPAAVRRRPGVGHQRQGRLAAEPAALDVGADRQGDVRAADGLPLPAHGRE